MAERWRQPVKVHKVEEDSNSADMIAGEWHRGARWTLDAEGVARIRAGYVCVMCLEPHESPFPDACSLCGYAMKARQTKDMEVEFAGSEHVGPATTLSDELARLDETSERRIWLPGSSITVPSGVS